MRAIQLAWMSRCAGCKVWRSRIAAANPGSGHADSHNRRAYLDAGRIGGLRVERFNEHPQCRQTARRAESCMGQ